jgi:osmotically-inducible protein OsmY
MNHRYDDDNYSRRERDWNRDREREGREGEWGRQEGSRSSFYPGGYGFDEPSSPYGQREPYSTSGSGGGSYGASGYGQYRGEGQGGHQQGRDESRSYSPQDYSREWRSEGRGGSRGSRYSESQYGQGRSGQGEYDPRRNWGGRSSAYRSSQGSEDWDRGSSYGDRGRSTEWQYGNRGSQRSGSGGSDYYSSGSRHGGGRYTDEDYGSARRYGVGYTGSPDFDRDRSFGDDRFTRRDEPRYYGTGYYAEGTSAFGGGYDEQRRGERPGFFRRLFGKGPKGYQRSDERLREDISERLMQSDEIDSSEVTITVASGKVTLEGTVPDRYMKHAIEDLVDACPGVQDIDNRVRVDRNMGASGTSGYTGVSSASGTTPGSTSSTGTSYGSTGTAGMSSGSSYGAGSTTGTTATPTGTTQTGTNRSSRKDS